MAKREIENTPTHYEESGEVPLTLNAVIKWTGLITTVVTAIVSLIWFAAILKGDMISLRSDMQSMQQQQKMINDQRSKEIDKLSDRADKAESAVVDLNRKLDVAVTLLQRIDAKVGKP